MKHIKTLNELFESNSNNDYKEIGGSEYETCDHLNSIFKNAKKYGAVYVHAFVFDDEDGMTAFYGFKKMPNEKLIKAIAKELENENENEYKIRKSSLTIQKINNKAKVGATIYDSSGGYPYCIDIAPIITGALKNNVTTIKVKSNEDEDEFSFTFK